LLQAFQQTLVAGIAGYRHAELQSGLDDLVEFLHRQHAPVIGKRVYHHGGILACLDNLIEVADGPIA
jgi:hypothetical protein